MRFLFFFSATPTAEKKKSQKPILFKTDHLRVTRHRVQCASQTSPRRHPRLRRRRVGRADLTLAFRRRHYPRLRRRRVGRADITLTAAATTPAAAAATTPAAAAAIAIALTAALALALTAAAATPAAAAALALALTPSSQTRAAGASARDVCSSGALERSLQARRRPP